MVIDPVTGGGNGGFVHLVGLLIASAGGYIDGFSSKKHNLYVNTPLRNKFINLLSKSGLGLAAAGVVWTAVNVVGDDTLTNTQKVAQIL